MPDSDARQWTRNSDLNGSTSGDWVLRWHTAQDPKPRLLQVSQGALPSIGRFDTDEGAFTVIDGYLFDRDELTTQLQAPPRISDASLAAVAYQKWSTRLFERLRGGFLLIVWDQKRESLIVGRDAIGLHPCYFCWRDKLFLASASLEAILAQPEVRGSFNRDVIAEYIHGSLSSHQRFETYYEEVRRLPSAHWLSLTRHQLDITRYWDAVPPGFTWASAEEISQFEPLLERAVSRCLSVGADSIAMSGGFDSVSIAVLAAEQLQDKLLPYAISMRFSDPVCDEGTTQMAVAKALGMAQMIKTLDESLAGRTHIDVSETLSKISPGPVLSVWQSFYTGLFSSAPPGCSRMLMGTGGDDLLNVDLRYGADCLATLDLAALWRFLRVCQRTSPFSPARVAKVVLWDNAVRYELRRLASTALGQISPRSKNWLRARLRKRALVNDAMMARLEERRETAPSIEISQGERSYVAAMRYLTQAPILLHELEQAHAWGREMGFTLLYPYFDQDFAALLLRTHPKHLLKGGKAKGPLRRLVAQRLPSITLPSRKVDFTHMIHGVLRTDGGLKWQSLGGPRMFTELGISSPQLINPLMENYFAGRNDNWLQVWRVLSTEMWLRARSGLSETTV